MTDFEIPPRPKPRDRYFVLGTEIDSGPGMMASTMVNVFRRADSTGKPEVVGQYKRNYGLLHTFEPFRQCRREFALISPDYTGTSVMDLATGSVIASEPYSPMGFCPVGYYVPDWWDVHDETVMPGSEYWNADYEWPSGEFGFVWGCVWGDDDSWKVQFLDLTEIQSGVIRREERFGYLELATHGFRNPCFERETLAQPRGTHPPPFIKLVRRQGKTNVTFAVKKSFDFATGNPLDYND